MNNAAGKDEHWHLTVEQSCFLYIFARKKDNNNKNIKKHKSVYRRWYRQIKRCIYIWKWEHWKTKTGMCPLKPREKWDRHFRQEHPLTITLIVPLCKHTVQKWLNWKHMMGMNLQEPNKSPSSSHPLLLEFVYCMMGLCLRFLSVHSLTLWKMSENNKATFTTNLLHPHLPCRSCWHYTEILRSVCSHQY